MFHVAYDSNVKLVAEIDDKDIFAEKDSLQFQMEYPTWLSSLSPLNGKQATHVYKAKK